MSTLASTIAANMATAAPRPCRLKFTDRCDSCGTQAYVAAEIAGTDLMFCAHHFMQWEPKIRATAAELLDERWQLDRDEQNRKRL